jgi:hypothetical protein
MPQDIYNIYMVRESVEIQAALTSETKRNNSHKLPQILLKKRFPAARRHAGMGLRRCI